MRTVSELMKTSLSANCFKQDKKPVLKNIKVNQYFETDKMNLKAKKNDVKLLVLHDQSYPASSWFLLRFPREKPLQATVRYFE